MESHINVIEETTHCVTLITGDIFCYSHGVHGSVGKYYCVEYDQDAFYVQSSIKYDRPEDVRAGMCGADSATKTYHFKTLKTGEYSVRILHKFRGATTQIITYKITVNNDGPRSGCKLQNQ